MDCHARRTLSCKGCVELCLQIRFTSIGSNLFLREPLLSVAGMSGIHNEFDWSEPLFYFTDAWYTYLRGQTIFIGENLLFCSEIPGIGAHISSKKRYEWKEPVPEVHQHTYSQTRLSLVGENLLDCF